RVRNADHFADRCQRVRDRDDCRPSRMGERRRHQADQGGARAIAAPLRRPEYDYALILRLRPTPSATFARLCKFFWAASSTCTIADALSAFMRSILAATAICTSAICEPTKAVAIDTGSIPVPFLRQVYQRTVNTAAADLT